jgi:hypothetical protein
MLGYTGPRSVASPSIFEMGRSSFDLDGDEFLDEVMYAWRTPFRSLLETHAEPYSPFEDPSWMGVTTQDWCAPKIAGNIGITPEPGGKARLFAAPSLHTRWLTYPLFLMSREVLRKVPEDCTYDQEKFKKFLLRCLQENKTVSSIDQSQATDLFPRDIITLVAILLGLPSQAVEEFSELSGRPYRVPESASILADHDRCISWERGQPLGVYPSFNMYALAHHAIVRGIFKRLKRPPCYALLGDDIAIADSAVATEYVRIMELIGCSINKAKSYTSSFYAEGAGYRVHAEIAVAPGRFPIANQFNYQSFIKDDLLRTEILENLPRSRDNPIVNGKLTKDSVIRLLGARMSDPRLDSELKFFLSCKSVSFKSPSLEYPELFLGVESRVDQSFYLPLKKTLMVVRSDASKELKNLIDRVVNDLSETIVWYVFSDEELSRLISTLPLLRPFRFMNSREWTSAERESLGYLSVVDSDSPIPSYRRSVDDEAKLWKEINSEIISLEASVESLNTLKRIPGAYKRPTVTLQKIESLKSRLSLVEGPEEWFNLKVPTSYLDPDRKDKVSMDIRVLRQELKVLFTEVLQSRGALKTPSAPSEFRSIHRKLNNCLKFSGFKYIIREYL